MIEIVERRLDASLNELREALTPLAPQLLMAAGIMLQAILQGNRILACGVRERSQLAAHFARLMIGQFEHERPGLPTMALQEFPGGREPFAKAIRALGGQGDVLFAIGRNDTEGLQAALEAGREREMQRILLTCGEEDTLRDALQTRDCLICLPPGRAALAHEGQLMVIHALCDLIDRQLLGLEGAE